MGWREMYRHYWIETADPGMYATSLYGSILWVPILTVSYLYFVLYWGPRFMEGRKPYSLKTFVKYYNVFQIVANAMLVYRSQIVLRPWDTTLFCQWLRHVDSEKYHMVTFLFWCTLVMKQIDYIETCVFVLRKKYNQVTFLHLYHHVSTVLLLWLGGRSFPGTLGLLVIAINSAMHVVMYTYYLLSTIKSTILQNMLRSIKPIITSLQIVQLAQFVYLGRYALAPGCFTSKTVTVTSLCIFIINLILFGNFYIKNYMKKKTT